MQKERKKKISKIMLEIGGTIIGAFILAVSISLFLLPNQLSSGGVAGIATVTYYLFNLPMGLVIICINVPMFIFSSYKIGKSFFIKSIIGTISLSFFVDWLDKFTPLTEDRFLACVYGGIIMGIGTAILLKANSSTGGSDLVSYIAKKYKPEVKSSQIIAIIDIVIILINVIFFKEIEIGLYSVIAIYLMGKVIDILFEGIDFTKLVFVVSDKSEEIAKQIEIQMQRGVTGLLGKGMYTQQKKLVLLCAISRKDISRIKRIINEIDSQAFIVITNSREVVGLGFKNF